MNRLLLTGFGAFDRFTTNPSSLLVNQLDGRVHEVRRHQPGAKDPANKTQLIFPRVAEVSVSKREVAYGRWK